MFQLRLEQSVIPYGASWVDHQDRSMGCFFCVAAAFWRNRAQWDWRSGAKPGDRTMLDALDPFVKALKKGGGGKASREAILAPVEAAERGLEATARMKPRLGRSSYLGDRVLGCPDPGAKAVAVWLRAASEALFAR
jgi:dihydroxyacetone kinase